MLSGQDWIGSNGFGMHRLDGVTGGLNDLLDLRRVGLFGGDERGFVCGVIGDGILGGECLGDGFVDVLFTHVAHHALDGDSGFVHGFFLPLSGCVIHFLRRGGKLLRKRRRLPVLIMLCLVKTEEIETQRVRYDAEARKTHRERAEHRLKRPAENRDPYARGERDADDIIDERPEKILTNVAQRRAAEPNGGGNVAHAAFHKHNVRGVDGDVRSGADGETDVRARERRGVVDAVAHHGDLADLAQLSDHGLLAIREHPGHHGVDPGRRADGGGSAGVIAREHHNAKPHALELPDGFGGIGLHNVRHGDHAEKPVVPGKIERCFPFVRKRGGALHLLAYLTEKSSHGCIDYPLMIAEMAEGVQDVYFHIIFDGRSTETGSAPAMLRNLEEKLRVIGRGQIVDGVGRGIALDRDGNYGKIKKAYEAMVLGIGTTYQR